MKRDRDVYTILEQLFPDVSKDPRTLSHIPKSCEMVTLSEGAYIHLRFVDRLLRSFPKSIDFQRNADSLLLFRTSLMHLWPIFGTYHSSDVYARVTTSYQQIIGTNHSCNSQDHLLRDYSAMQIDGD